MKEDKQLSRPAHRRRPPRPSMSKDDLRAALATYFGSEIKTDFELGPNGGVLVTLTVPGTAVTVRGEFFPPNDERDHFEFVEPLIPFLMACAILRTTPKSLYSRCPVMASSRKVSSRWFFNKKLFYGIDFGEETELPTRKEIIADRTRRRNAGEVLKAGRHAAGCGKDHGGACRSRRPALTKDERDRNRRRLLDDLGK